MKEIKSKFVVYTPFTGLGLYGGFRGNRWLRNRIKIFKQFVIPSLQNQSSKDFVHWISWREEDRTNPHVIELREYMEHLDWPVIFTYHGIAFWDDKYPDDVARERLFNALKGSLPELMDVLPDADEVIMLLQPSDDLYSRDTIALMRMSLENNPEYQAISYKKGYICNYNTGEVLNYDPTTNPPFFAIRFPRDKFFDPGKHMNYTGPYKSHEYVGDNLKVYNIGYRGFMVGTHGENISTHFNHPFGSELITEYPAAVRLNFGIARDNILKLPNSFRKWIMRHLPYKWQKKLRYWWGERLFNKFYEFIRN